MVDDLHVEPWMPKVAGFEPSGLCRVPGQRALYVVGDEGHLAVVPVDTGVPQIESIEPRTDLEGVAVDPDGRVLVLAERKNQLWQVEAGRRVSKWRIRPKGRKNEGYEGLTVVPGVDPQVLLSLQGGKQSMLRSFALPGCDGGKLERRSEQELPWPDVAGLCWYQDALYALSDSARILAKLRLAGQGWEVEQTWKTPAPDLEGVVIFEGWIYLAQDSGGIWRGKWASL